MRRSSEHGRRLVDDVYGAIKDDICMGRLHPGQRLVLGEICKGHDVSLSVVREAVTRLASEDLVQARPQQGYSVWPLSVPDLLDLSRVRIEIESLCLRDSIGEGDLTWESELVAAHHRLAGAARQPDEPARTPNYAWMKAHSEFHAALASACPSPRLRQLRQQLFDAAELYRYWSATLTDGRKRNVAAEHRALLDAALVHDVEKGVKLIARHIQRTSDLLLEARHADATPVRAAH
jgi:DNA-binding GntR family transcriptional regulator